MTKQAEETEAQEGAAGESTDGAERPGATAVRDQDAQGPQEATGRTLTASEWPTNRWDPDQAREAGKRGGAARAAQRRRDREEAELAAALGAEGAALGVMDRAGRRTSTADAQVIAALEREAKRGDVAAARALLDWRRLDSAQGASPEALSLALLATQLPSTLLAALRSTVLDLVRESQAGQEEPAQSSIREGSVEADRSLPSGAAALAERDATPPSDGTPSPSTARTPQIASQSGNDPQTASDTADLPDTTI